MSLYLSPLWVSSLPLPRKSLLWARGLQQRRGSAYSAVLQKESNYLLSYFYCTIYPCCGVFYVHTVLPALYYCILQLFVGLFCYAFYAYTQSCPRLYHTVQIHQRVSPSIVHWSIYYGPVRIYSRTYLSAYWRTYGIASYIYIADHVALHVAWPIVASLFPVFVSYCAIRILFFHGLFGHGRCTSVLSYNYYIVQQIWEYFYVRAMHTIRVLYTFHTQIRLAGLLCCLPLCFVYLLQLYWHQWFQLWQCLHIPGAYFPFYCLYTVCLSPAFHPSVYTPYRRCRRSGYYIVLYSVFLLHVVSALFRAIHGTMEFYIISAYLFPYYTCRKAGVCLWSARGCHVFVSYTFQCLQWFLESIFVFPVCRFYIIYFLFHARGPTFGNMFLRHTTYCYKSRIQHQISYLRMQHPLQSWAYTYGYQRAPNIMSHYYNGIPVHVQCFYNYTTRFFFPETFFGYMFATAGPPLLYLYGYQFFCLLPNPLQGYLSKFLVQRCNITCHAGPFYIVSSARRYEHPRENAVQYYTFDFLRLRPSIYHILPFRASTYKWQKREQSICAGRYCIVYKSILPHPKYVRPQARLWRLPGKVFLPVCCLFHTCPNLQLLRCTMCNSVPGTVYFLRRSVEMSRTVWFVVLQYNYYRTIFANTCAVGWFYLFSFVPLQQAYGLVHTPAYYFHHIYVFVDQAVLQREWTHGPLCSLSSLGPRMFPQNYLYRKGCPCEGYVYCHGDNVVTLCFRCLLQLRYCPYHAYAYKFRSILDLYVYTILYFYAHGGSNVFYILFLRILLPLQVHFVVYYRRNSMLFLLHLCRYKVYTSFQRGLLYGYHSFSWLYWSQTHLQAPHYTFYHACYLFYATLCCENFVYFCCPGGQQRDIHVWEDFLSLWMYRLWPHCYLLLCAYTVCYARSIYVLAFYLSRYNLLPKFVHALRCCYMVQNTSRTIRPCCRYLSCQGCHTHCHRHCHCHRHSHRHCHYNMSYLPGSRCQILCAVAKTQTPLRGNTSAQRAVPPPTPKSHHGLQKLYKDYYIHLAPRSVSLWFRENIYPLRLLLGSYSEETCMFLAF
uniref:PF1055L n=1 Tax=African swine fever virus TaxID=10497 RepID=A0A6G7KTM0_ASF